MFHNNLDDCLSLLKGKHCNLFYLSYLVSHLRQQEVFINHNQNPEKESVKITVGRLLVVSGTAPLSQREGALMPSPGLGSHHIWPIRGKLGGSRNQWEDREQLRCTPLVMALPGTNNGPKWWKWRKELVYLRSNISNTFVLLSQIVWYGTQIAGRIWNIYISFI